MRKFLYPLLLLTAAVLLTGCATEAEPAAKVEDTPPLSIPNPVVTTNKKGLADAGLPIEPPEGAMDVTYSLIDSSIAQIQFTYNELSYVYRASRELTDISGVYEQFEEEALNVEADYEDFSLSVTVRSIVGGGELGTWTSDGVTFSLYVRSAIGAEDHAALCTLLGEQAHYAITGSGMEAEVTAQYLRDTLNIYVDAPVGAEHVAYSIYDEDIVRIDFVLNDVVYELRSAHKPSLLPLNKADYFRTEESAVESSFFTGKMTAYYNDDADAVILWEIDDVSYQLYTQKYASIPDMFTLSLRIATDAYFS